jgi:hypothetical protein
MMARLSKPPKESKIDPRLWWVIEKDGTFRTVAEVGELTNHSRTS